MLILRKPLDTVTPSELSELWWDQVSESTEIELKSDLPCKAGPMKDPWYAGGAVGDYARNQIAEEIIAFANTLGGVVCIGVNETKDHPKRADSPNPVPRVHELARRLRQAVYDVIDPPLPVLEAAGVVLDEASGAGVVLVRVPQSRRRPHRHAVSKEVFVRRADESAKVSMREIQELTIQSVAEGTRVDNLILDRRKLFSARLSGWHNNLAGGWGGGLHMIGVPTTRIDLGRVTHRPQLVAIEPRVSAVFKDREPIPCSWPHARNLSWRPMLRALSASTGVTAPIGTDRDREASYIVDTNGVCEMSFMFRASQQRPGLFAGWCVGALGLMLTWIDRIRNEVGSTVEYALAAELRLLGAPISLVQFGATSFEEAYGAALPNGAHVFPTMSIGPRDEFPAHLARFNEDIWNLAGHEVAKAEPTFSLQT